MSANLEIKKELVKGLTEQLSTAKSMVFVNYSGITVAEDTALRKEFRENGVTYKVFKNRLLIRALNELGIQGYDAKLLEGTTAVAFSEDEVAPAKIFCKHAKELQKMEVKFGIVNSEIMDKAQIEALSKIPDKNTLIAMLLGQLQAPVSALARALNAIGETKAN